ADIPQCRPVKRPGLHILVAEDNLISQQLIVMMLESGGHRVTVASDGESALDKHDQELFDLVILDMNMPACSGLEAAKIIRSLEANAGRRRVPIIMLTAAASVDLRDESKDAGVEVFLTKPVDPGSLLRAVDQACALGIESSDPFRAAPPKSAAQPGYLDHVLLREMASLSPDPTFVQTLADQFSRNAGGLLDQIEAALLNKQYGEYRELVHALKGSSMMAGAIRLQDAAARAETISERKLGSVEDAVIAELRKTLSATRKELLELPPSSFSTRTSHGAQ
ncbi:MAG: response regulator, partial [Betaproteobacteria bacterium]